MAGKEAEGIEPCIGASPDSLVQARGHLTMCWCQASPAADEGAFAAVRTVLTASLSRVAVLVRYTNDINPFGDSNLTEQFVWGKKKEKEGTADRQLSKREIREMQKKNVDEIEKVTCRACGVTDRPSSLPRSSVS